MWHTRLGHPSDQAVNMLQQDLNFTKDSHVSPCDICHKAKQTREPFPFSDHQTTEIGELIHLDLWGPYKVDLKTRIVQNFRTLLTVEERRKHKLWFFTIEHDLSNRIEVKLCLEHEVKRGNKVVKKELIVALRGEIYFGKFIINLEEDDVEPRVILGRTFVRMTKAITDFRAGTVTTYPDIDPFLEDIEEEEKSLDDWDHLLDFNLDNVPLLGGEELLPFVCKMGINSCNKKRSMENLNFFYQDIGTSSSARVRPIIETMSYHDKYKKVLDEIWKDKVELDGMIVKEEEEAVKRIKGKALKEKDDPGAFIFPIRLEGQVNENALADTGSGHQMTIGRTKYKKTAKKRRNEEG
ncbi:putative reverse transcriptase domain-containing protein [Tanacetum coccineum]